MRIADSDETQIPDQGLPVNADAGGSRRRRPRNIVDIRRQYVGDHHACAGGVVDRVGNGVKDALQICGGRCLEVIACAGGHRFQDIYRHNSRSRIIGFERVCDQADGKQHCPRIFGGCSLVNRILSADIRRGRPIVAGGATVADVCHTVSEDNHHLDSARPPMRRQFVLAHVDTIAYIGRAIGGHTINRYLRRSEIARQALVQRRRIRIRGQSHFIIDRIKLVHKGFGGDFQISNRIAVAGSH